MKVKPRSEAEQLPLPKAQECPACLDTAIVPRDGSARVKTGEWLPFPRIMARFKPCPLCPLGKKEAALWAAFEAELVLSIPEGDIVDGEPGHTGPVEIRALARATLDRCNAEIANETKARAAGGDV